MSTPKIPTTSVELTISKFIYNLFNNNEILRYVPNLFGLIPYEIYVIPGMYLSLLQVIWLGTPNPVQFHLLPHWFSFSLFLLLKHAFKKERPGCFYEDLQEFIDEGHCADHTRFQSFPSSHAGIAMALASALYMEMTYSEDPHFFEMKIRSRNHRNIISSIGFLITIFIGIHRLSKGYHGFFDVIAGYIIGFCIGFISWTVLEYYKKMYQKLCSNAPNDPYCANYKYSQTKDSIFSNYWTKTFKFFGSSTESNKFINGVMGITRIILSIAILYLMFRFFIYDLSKLATIQH